MEHGDLAPMWQALSCEKWTACSGGLMGTGRRPGALGKQFQNICRKMEQQHFMTLTEFPKDSVVTLSGGQTLTMKKYRQKYRKIPGRTIAGK